MLSKEVLKRISELNRQPATVAPKQRHAAWRTERSQSNDLDVETNHRTVVAAPQNHVSRIATEIRPVSGDRASSSDLPEGRELETPLGRHYIIERPLHDLWDGAERWLRRLSPRTATENATENASAESKVVDAEAPTDAHSRPKRKGSAKPPPDLETMRRAFPDSVMFLDLETCGFSGSMVFLAGVLVAGPKGMTLVQLLARHYGEERAMMHTLWQIAAQQTVLATFNGKSFDWPVVRDRSILHHIEPRGPLADDAISHCDLLHLSRRRWRGKLPNCKLQTLERYVCGRHRTGDIPGRDIPDAYHQFVRSGDAWEIRNVLHHNALDLVTLFQLSLVMLLEPPKVPAEKGVAAETR